MRKEYGRAVRELFAEGLAHVSPEFEAVRKHDALVGLPGERAFRRTVSPEVVQWLVVMPHQQAEVFFVEVGWSRLGRFPHLEMRPSNVRPADAGPADEVLLRLRSLAGENDMGWTIEAPPLGGKREEMLAYIAAQVAPMTKEAARERVAPVVGDALRLWVDVGRPFLDRHTGGA